MLKAVALVMPKVIALAACAGASVVAANAASARKSRGKILASIVP
jgi:hypothetical protein